jgi:hypothetical protein
MALMQMHLDENWKKKAKALRKDYLSRHFYCHHYHSVLDIQFDQFFSEESEAEE